MGNRITKEELEKTRVNTFTDMDETARRFFGDDTLFRGKIKKKKNPKISGDFKIAMMHKIKNK